MLSEVIANKVQHIIQKSIDNDSLEIMVNIEVYPERNVYIIKEENVYREYEAERSEIDG